MSSAVGLKVYLDWQTTYNAVMAMMVELVFFIVGAFASYIIDVWWWSIDYRKAERGLEFHEHYHVGLELLILSLILYHFTLSALAFIPVGAGFGFITAEWRQVVEVAGRKVQPGHPFAYGSKHFRQSTVFGFLLLVILAVAVLWLLK